MESKTAAILELLIDAGQSLLDELPLPYAELDPQGRVVRVNRALREINASEAPDPVGHLFWEWMPPSDWPEAAEEHREAMRSEDEIMAGRRSLYVQSGEFRFFEIYRRLIRGRDGQPLGLRVLCVDIADGLHALEDASRARHKLERIFDRLPQPTLVTDALGLIRYSNRAVERLLGWSQEEMLDWTVESLPIVEVFGTSMGGVGFNHALEGECCFEAMIEDKSGQRKRVEIHSMPLEDEGVGFTDGVVMSMRRLDGESKPGN